MPNTYGHPLLREIRGAFGQCMEQGLLPDRIIIDPSVLPTLLQSGEFSPRVSPRADGNCVGKIGYMYVYMYDLGPNMWYLVAQDDHIPGYPEIRFGPKICAAGNHDWRENRCISCGVTR